MIILSKFAENLCDLMAEQGLTTKAFAVKLNIPAPTITRYRKGQHLPNAKNLVAIADYFHCSTDFLLGAEPENSSLTFQKTPPFSERIAVLPKELKLSYYAFYHQAGIPESTFFEWKNGSAQPTIESLQKIAEKFGCSVDFILGRER